MKRDWFIKENYWKKSSKFVLRVARNIRFIFKVQLQEYPNSVFELFLCKKVLFFVQEKNIVVQ